MREKDKKFICQNDVEACDASKKSVENAMAIMLSATKRHAEMVEKIKVLW